MFGIVVANVIRDFSLPLHMHRVILLVVLACLGQELVYSALLECDLQAFLVLVEELGAHIAVRLPIAP